MEKNEVYYMKEALKEAKKAYEKEEIPVGAVIVKGNKIIARAHNLRETKNCSTSHAEILAIEKANKKLNAWRLENCEMYITLEPCMMCMGAIINSRIKKIYIGTLDPKTGSYKSVINIKKYKFNHDVEVEEGILKDECEYILKDFFKILRKKKRRKRWKKITFLKEK
jgi:tRNA(adenine34) deaminase